MFSAAVKPTRGTASIIGIALFVLTCSGIFALAENFEKSASQAPIRSLVVTIEARQLKELFEQLHKFSDKHDFQYNLTDYGGQGEYFLVEIRGGNVHILANETKRDLTTFDISFFAPSYRDPIPDKEYVNDLVIDLIAFLSEIPNVTITEE